MVVVPPRPRPQLVDYCDKKRHCGLFFQNRETPAGAGVPDLCSERVSALCGDEPQETSVQTGRGTASFHPACVERDEAQLQSERGNGGFL